ncbi:Conserved_hypothetical protein [Hexamita inflata]|uniref:Uncharacterized protein n=1 Tax=Hexamita inflata TaxID=28002 RepID=A0AA86UD21_9EUKA|nr:Conserved hypothetical protein [Hexamita inflata]
MNIINDKVLIHILSKKQRLVRQKPVLKRIQPKHLMHVFKPHPDIDAFFCAENNKIRIFNANYDILSEHDVNLQMYANIQFNGETCYMQPQFKTCYVCKGIIYIHVFDTIYQVVDKKLQEAAKIPQFQIPHFTSMYSFGRCMFTLNDELYVSNARRQLLVLNNGKLKYVKDVFMDEEEYNEVMPTYYQLNNNVYMFDRKAVYAVKANLQLQKVCDIEMHEYFGFAIEGIIVLHTAKYDKVLFINMLTQQYKRVVNDWQIMADRWMSIYEDNGALFKLKQKRFKDYFGDDYKIQIDHAIYSYQKEQFTKFNSLKQLVDQFLFPVQDLLSDSDAEIVSANHAYLFSPVSQQIQITYIKPYQLMHVLKLRPDLDIFIAVEDNFIHIFDSNYLLLDQIPVSFDFYAGKFTKNFNGGRLSVNQAAMFQVQLAAGVIYFQAYEKLYKIVNRSVQFITTVPNTDNSSWFTPMIFALNDQLYCYDFNCDIYYLTNNQFKKKVVREQPFLFPSYFGKVLMYDQRGVSSIRGDFQKQLVCPLPELDDVALMHGVYVAHDQLCKQVYVIDMVTNKTAVSKNDFSLYKDNIFSVLEVGKSGLKLKDSKLIELFGPEHPKKVQEYYENFIMNQQQRFPIYNQTTEALIGFKVLFKYFNQRISDKMTAKTNKINKMNGKTQIQKENIKELVFKLDKMTQNVQKKFLEFNSNIIAEQ